jgi:pimeloyl-ACP methyl ester carboxylesterase
METSHSHELPSWLDRKEFPFASRFMDIDENSQHYSLHYIDEGQGEVLLFVHGTPVWSFLYRHCIKRLSAHYRCVALDHLGFGLSDKPHNADYSPEAHSRRLEIFIQKLGLENITIITQDYGGPISLDYAGRHAENVVRFVIANSWMWSLPRMEQGGKLFSNALGKWLYLRYGFSAKVMIPQAFGDKKNLSRSIHQHYLNPLNTPQNRMGTFGLVKALANNHAWYRGIEERQKALADKPVLMLWGMKDRFVPHSLMMPLWKQVWNNAEYIEFTEAGHFVEEEAPERVCKEIEHFLAKNISQVMPI